MTTTPQTEAQRLADAIDPGNEGSKCILTIDVAYAAAELRRLDALVAHLTADRDNVATELATRTEANRALEAERDQLRAQLAKAVAEEREAFIDIVAMHGGSIEIEAAIEARSNT